MDQLPLAISYVGVPPIKCQGIKTRLVPFILRSISWQPPPEGRWVEPFVGSGAIVLNLAPQRALLTDTNEHIVHLYKAIQSGTVNRTAVREYLTEEGRNLRKSGADHYYVVRERFNQTSSPFDFLFLSHACFNGVMRFNQSGKFNVPFCHKPDRFSQAYVTKIANKVNWAAKQMCGKDWDFRVAHWSDTLATVAAHDFVYLDPPYIGRHTDYYNAWNDSEARRLAATVRTLSCGFALSMWLKNRYRVNPHIGECWYDMEMRVCSHFYHVGSTEELRNEMDEALIIKPGFATPDEGRQPTRPAKAENQQLSLPIPMPAP